MVIDFHSHILPGIDDGSSSPEESIAMLGMEAEQGIAQVIVTPHFYARYDTPEHFLQQRAASCVQLKAALTGRGKLPRIRVGAEVHYFSGISDSEVLSRLTIGRTNSLLLEMPSAPWSERMYREIEGIYEKQGILPVIAHVDRYIRPFHTHGIPKRLEALPVLVQANASFFLDRSTRSMALRMLRKGQIHLLGSDCHNLASRQPNLGEAVAVIRKHLGEEALQRIAHYQKIALTAEET